jgi:protein O-mannosyl-transferase
VIFRRLGAVLLIVGAALLAYHNVHRLGFVLDDFPYILRNPGLASLAGIPRLFVEAHVSAATEFYRPLSASTFAIDRALFGLWAAPYHLHSLLWHLGASLALLALARRVLGSARPALVAALLFAVHPIHTEAVTGVVGRAEVMVGLFTFLGLRAHLATRLGPAARLGLALPLALAALFSKESGAAFPLLALVVDLHDRRTPREALIRVLPYTAPIAIYGVLRAVAMHGHPLVQPAAYFLLGTPGQNTLTAVDALGRYALLLLWPHPLSADYSYQALPASSGLLDPRTALTLVALVALLALGLRLRRTFPPLLLSLGLFLAALLPVSNLVVRIGVLLAERLLYVPSIAVCLLAGAVAEAAMRRVRPPLVFGLALALAAGLALLTADRNLDWSGPTTLWRDTVARVPRSGLAHANWAFSCVPFEGKGCTLLHLRRAVELDPTRADFQSDLARLLRGERL